MASAASVALNFVVAPICFALSLKACSSSPVAPDTAATFDMPASKSMPTFSAMPATPAAASDRYFILPAALDTLFPKFVMFVDNFPIRDCDAFHSSCSFFNWRSLAAVSSASRCSFLYAAELLLTPASSACARALLSLACFSSVSLTALPSMRVFCSVRTTLLGFILRRVFIPLNSDCTTLALAFNFLNA